MNVYLHIMQLRFIKTDKHGIYEKRQISVSCILFDMFQLIIKV